MTAPDLKRGPRIVDDAVLAIFHRDNRECVLCGYYDRRQREYRLSAHHIHRHPRDDVFANLVMLCGSGTTGCHGDIEGGVRVRKSELGRYLLAERPDFVAYVTGKLGGGERGLAWIERYLYVEAVA